MTRIPKRPQPAVQDWMKYWRRMFRAKHCTPPSDQTILLLAGLCATRGTPESDEGKRAYYALSKMIVNPGLRTRIHKTVELLAQNVTLLYRVIDCIEAYDKFIVANGGKELDKGRYQLDKIVKVMLEVPEAESYVKSLVQSPLRTPNAVFHPRTLDRAKTKLKGVFGYDAGDHQDQIKNKVRVIE